MTTPPSLDALKSRPMAKLVERYVNLRDQKKEIEDELKKQTDPLIEAMTLLSTAMQAKLHEDGATSAPTPHGTAYITTTETASIVDFEALWAFMKANDVPELLQKRVTLSEVRAYNETHPDTPVPGVVTEAIQSVRVRAK